MKTKTRPELKLKNTYIGDDYVSFTFTPIGINPRGVSSCSMNLGGDFIVSIAVDRETAKQTAKRQKNSKKLIDTVIGAISVKPKDLKEYRHHTKERYFYGSRE